MEAIREEYILNGSLPWTHEDYRVIQPIWDLHLKYEKYVASPLYPIITSIIFYFIAVLPWTYIDLFGKDWKWIQKYKIQPDKEVTWPLVRKAVMLTMWNHLVYILPLTIAQWIWTPPSVLPPIAPGLFEMTWQCLAALAIFDFEYFVWHSVHHKVRFLYKHVHAIHHQYHSPNSWVTQYLHPWELISVGFFTTTSPWIIGCHPFTCFVFQQFAIIVSVEGHIGYDLPFMPHNFIQLWGGVIKHDMHHQKPLTNFAPFYNFWDMVFGTYCPGKLAGGVKSKALLDWEKKEKALKKKIREKREALQAAPEEHSFLN